MAEDWWISLFDSRRGIEQAQREATRRALRELRRIKLVYGSDPARIRIAGD
jgi:hypothetical protein